MKKSQFESLVRQITKNVLQEDAYGSDQSTGVVKISSKDPTKQQKIDTAKKNNSSYELYEDEELDEMARIPTLFKLTPEVNIEKYAEGSAIRKILNYLKENPEGKSKLDIVKGIGGKAQQEVNQVINFLVNQGDVVSGGLSSTPKYSGPKEPGSGKRGRPESGNRYLIARTVIQKLLKGEEPDESEISFLGAENIQKIKDDIVAGKIGKRGRKPGIGKNKEIPGEPTFDDERVLNALDDEDEYENEIEFEEPSSIGKGEKNLGNEVSKDVELLRKLENEKDAIIAKYKVNGKITDIAGYKVAIGNIPDKIKKLQNRIQGIGLGGDDDLSEGYNNMIKKLLKK